MRLIVIAVALLAICVPAIAQPSALSKGAPIRIAMSLPDDGNASTALLKVPILHKGKGGKLSVTVRAEKPVPKKYFATYRAVVKGSTLYIGPTFVFPHAQDNSAPIPAGHSTFDMTIFPAYTHGVVGAGGDNTQVLDLFIFDNGHPLLSNDPADRCTSCSYHLTGSGKKTLLRIDDLLTSHDAPPGCRLGFGVIVIPAAGDDNVNIQGFVVNSHTSAFDLSAFGFDPQPIAAAVESGAADAACDVPSVGQTRLRNFARPVSKSFTVTVDATHHHGVGKSNLCVRVSTSPAQAGSAAISLSGPSGAGTQTVALAADGTATAVFGITQYGSYTGSATVGSTSGSVSYNVDGSAGQAFSCPGPQ